MPPTGQEPQPERYDGKQEHAETRHERGAAFEEHLLALVLALRDRQARLRSAAHACSRRFSSSLMIVSASVGTTSHTTCSTTSRDSARTASTWEVLSPSPPSLPAKSAGKAAGSAWAAVGIIGATGRDATSTAGALLMAGLVGTTCWTGRDATWGGAG